MTNNLKIVKGKAPLALLPRDGLEVASAALEQGAGKYFPNNWRKCDPDEVPTWYHAILRHMYALCDGETHDADSGVHHLGHVAAGALIALTLLGEKYQESNIMQEKPETRTLINSAKALFGDVPAGVTTSPTVAKSEDIIRQEDKEPVVGDFVEVLELYDGHQPIRVGARGQLDHIVRGPRSGEVMYYVVCAEKGDGLVKGNATKIKLVLRGKRTPLETKES